MIDARFWLGGRLGLALVWAAGCSQVGMFDDPMDAATSAATPPSRPDALDRDGGGPPLVDAAVVSTDACADPDGGLCGCGLPTFGPAPTDDAGQPQPVTTPDPAQVVAYQTMAAFDALAVGRWQRTAGQGELTCEQFGVEFTADHRLLPLVRGADGSIAEVIGPDSTSFWITFDDAGAPTHLMKPGLTTSAPIFFDGGRAMYFLYAPWPANYVRLP